MLLRALSDKLLSSYDAVLAGDNITKLN